MFFNKDMFVGKFMALAFFKVGVLLAGLLLTLNCSVANAQANLSSQPLSKKEQLKILEKETGLKGRKLRNHLQVLADAPPYDDEKIQQYVTSVGKKILAHSEHAHLPYRFIVLDSEIVNAFVQGTPYVYVNRALLSALNSEAELAAVMAHEIGHNVGKHSAKLQSRNRRNIFLANVASILAGSSSIGSAIQTQNQVNLYEYRRDNELEADTYSARYLHAANYDHAQMVNALAQLRDNNIFMAKSLNQNLSHQGLRASHPRSDVRLRKAIKNAGELPPGEAFIGREEYRNAINGLVYGPNYARNAPKGFRRFTSESLGITFLHPQDWVKTVKGSKIILKDPKQTLQFKITIEKTPEISKDKSSLDDLKAKYPELVNHQKIDPSSQRDLGTLGAVTAKRVALAKVARNTFHFEGIAKDNNINAEQDAYFVNIIRSFRRMTPKDKTAEYVTKIYFERLQPGETFASLAQDTGLSESVTELELRVINGYYPKGEAEPGTWIKKLRKEKIAY